MIIREWLTPPWRLEAITEYEGLYYNPETGVCAEKEWNKSYLETVEQGDNRLPYQATESGWILSTRSSSE